MKIQNKEEYRNISIKDMEFSTRVYNTLMRHSVMTLYDLIENIDKLLEFRNMGATSIKEIHKKINVFCNNNYNNSVSFSSYNSEIMDTYEQKQGMDTIIENTENFKNIKIEDLDFSLRVYNTLMRNSITTLYDLIENIDILPNFRNMGSTSIEEINNKLAEVDTTKFNKITQDFCGEKQGLPVELPDLSEEILNRPITDMKLTERIYNCLNNEDIITIRQLIAKDEKELCAIRNMGGLSLKTLKEQIELLYNLREDYFIKNSSQNGNINKITSKDKRELDIETASKLKCYGLTNNHLCEWYGVSKQNISQKLSKKTNMGCWCGKDLTESECSEITAMINAKVFFNFSNNIEYFLFNNKKDDCAFVIVSDKDIKCFFLANLPEKVQKLLKSSRMYQLTEEEIKGKESWGQIVHLLKKPYFQANDRTFFSEMARKRNQSVDDYSEFLYNLPYSHRESVNDERIIEALNMNTNSGITKLSSDPKYQWLRRLISESPYNTEEFIKFYGFKTENLEEEKKTICSPEIIEEENFSEKEMEEYTGGRNDLERVFRTSPLLGSVILTGDEFKRINDNTRDIIRGVLKFNIDVDLDKKMEITLCVINYAKEWNPKDEDSFWKYITSQFGYRDENGKLEKYIKKWIKDAIIKNKRWFVRYNGRDRYKSTIIIHAFATKKAWFSVFDFLYDFYITNLNSEYLENDPMIPNMVQILRKKFKGNEEVLDKDFSVDISKKSYLFQEGIIKLLIQKPEYTKKLLASLIKRIDDLVNHTSFSALCYEEKLCDEWLENKLKHIAESGNKKRISARRIIAIDYNLIKPVYQLENGTDIKIVFPDIRLHKNDFNKLTLKIVYGEDWIEERRLKFYGNELGKTLEGFSIDLDDYLRRTGTPSLTPNLIIYCDNEEIYNSGNTLFRDFLIFHKDKEIIASNLKKGGYHIIIPRESTLQINSGDYYLVKENEYISGYYMELENDFVLRINDEIVSFENSNSNDEIKVLSPQNKTGARYFENGIEYNIIDSSQKIHIILSNLIRKSRYQFHMNYEIIDLNPFFIKKKENNDIYIINASVFSKDRLVLEVFDLVNNRIVYKQNYKVFESINIDFNRSYYFSKEDYQGAKLKVNINGLEKEYSVISGESIINVTYDNGDLRVFVPIIKVTDNNGKIWDGSDVLWSKEVEQNCFLKVDKPEKCEVELILGSKSIGIDNNQFGLGNALFANTKKPEDGWLELKMPVSFGNDTQKYTLAKISTKEQFMRKPTLKTADNNLIWDMGYGFIGNKEGVKLIICENTEFEKEYDLDIENELIDDNFSLPLGEYNFSIFKKSNNLFSKKIINISEGVFYVGDINQLRFMNSIIELTDITFEYSSNKIRPSFIDHIEYNGIQYVPSEERECPVYTGIMYFVDKNGRRHEYSFEEKENRKGRKLYIINPVRIIFINENTLSITNKDEDGLYYYSFKDRDTREKFYQITDYDPDHEPDEFRKRLYCLADLYIYKKKRGNPYV